MRMSPLKLARGWAGTIRRHLRADPVSLDAALRRCVRRGVDVSTVIDIGASNGCWTRAAARYFPEASWFLLEAQRGHEPELAAFKASHRRVDYMIAAAGDTVGELYFDASDLWGGLASHEPLDGACIVVPAVTVDHVVQANGLRPPFVLKLDTHGFEVPILEGASRTLTQTTLIVMEAYNFQIAKGSLRFHEACTYMEARGFRCVDFCDPMHRPGDGAFWQFDLFFIPTNEPTFQRNEYQ